MKLKKRKNSIFLISTACLLILTLLILSIVENFGSISVNGTASKSSDYLSINSIKYPKTLFDDSKVHSIDIQVDDQAWSKMAANAEAEEYIPCTMVIDGVRVDEVGIRPKGNSSLSQISGMKSQNFSFKVEFDHYKNQTFDGLDKMALNNCTMDTTYMKDYLTQDMMNYMGVAAPLTSFVNIKLNGRDFGFYLAVEAVEDSFVIRNYGNNDGKLYKPDSLAISNFDFSDMSSYRMENGQLATDYLLNIMSGETYKDFDENMRADLMGDMIKVLLDVSNIRTDISGLVYIDDNPKSYKTIFDTAIFDTTEIDKKRLINSIKKLNSGEDIENTINVDSVTKYFVVHNFVNNYDAYTSIFSHNYFLYENNGKLSMIPWDYNLAFGALSLEAANSFIDSFEDYLIVDTKTYGMSAAKSMVNYPIDTPVFSVDLKERPMIYQILNNENYSTLYHQYFDEFISKYFESGHFKDLYSSTVEMISPYVKNDSKGFYSFEQFEDGVKELNKFCNLRAISIRGQLNKTIPATLIGQNENPESLIDTKDLDISKTLDFTSMLGVTGFSTDSFKEILNSFIGYVPEKYMKDGKIDTTKLTKDDFILLKENIGNIIPIAVQVVKSNEGLRNKVITSVMPEIILILSLIAVIVITILLNKYSRVKYKKRVGREKIET